MVDEWFTDAQRRLLLGLVIDAVTKLPTDRPARGDLSDILRIMSGVDTALFARRAYPSRGKGEPHDAEG